MLGGCFSFDILNESEGFVRVKVSGKGSKDLYRWESGGHRIQHISPTDSKKRVHTSTITVAVLYETVKTEFELNEEDLEIKCCRGSGSGGQNRNKRDTAVIIRHLPTGETVRSENQRSQLQNKMAAMELLKQRLTESLDKKAFNAQSAKVKEMVGSGERGDKIRSVQVQNGIVVDHIRNKRTDVKSYFKGDLDWLK